MLNAGQRKLAVIRSMSRKTPKPQTPKPQNTAFFFLDIINPAIDFLNYFLFFLGVCWRRGFGVCDYNSIQNKVKNTSKERSTSRNSSCSDNPSNII